jgi:hypothetical protein
VRRLFPSNKEVVPILAFILVIAISIDMLVSSFLDILHPHLPSTLQLILFIFLAAIIYGVNQRMSKSIARSKELQKQSDYRYFGIIYKSIAIVQYAIIVIIALTVLQMVFFSQFDTILIIAAIIVSFVPASIMMGLLSYNLLVWFKSNRSAAVLLYALSSAMVCIALGLNAGIYSGLLLHGPATIEGPQTEVHFSEINETTFGIAGALYFVGWMPFLLGFILIWAGTAFLMRHYSDKVGTLKLWTIISVPLAAYLIAIIPTMLLISQGRFVFDDPSLLHYRILFKAAVIAGGLFFGLIFFIIGGTIKKIPKTKNTAAYIVMAGYGIAMTTIILASPVYHATFPPFGIASSAFIAFASYLVSIGFYYSAISISTDASLRKEIKKIAAKEVQLIGSIASAQVEKEITNSVMGITMNRQNELERQTGIQSSLQEHEIRNYINEVIKEIKARQTSSQI